MKKRNNQLRSPVGTTILFMIAVLLLMTGTIGGIRAIPQIFNDDPYYGGIKTQNIRVALLENGQSISNGPQTEGALLQNLIRNGEHLKPGFPYDEVLTVHNSGDIPAYVRVTIYKYWLIETGKQEYEKYDEFPTSWINLHFTENTDWIHDEESDSNERSVYYYKNKLEADGQTSALTDTLIIDPYIVDLATKQETETENGKIFTTIWTADGKRFCIEVEVNAVQDHNALAAVKSAWGLTANDISRLGLYYPE